MRTILILFFFPFLGYSQLSTSVQSNQFNRSSVIPAFSPELHENGYMLFTGNELYLSDGSDWVLVATAASSVNVDDVTIRQDGNGDIYTTYVIPYVETAQGGTIGITNTGAINNTKNLTVNGNYRDGTRVFLKCEGTGFLRVVPETGETYTINGESIFTITQGETATLEYSAFLNDWILTGGNEIVDEALKQASPLVLRYNQGNTKNYNTVSNTVIDEWETGSSISQGSAFATPSNDNASIINTTSSTVRVMSVLNFTTMDIGVKLVATVYFDNLPFCSYYSNVSSATDSNLHIQILAPNLLNFFKKVRVEVRGTGASGIATFNGAGNSFFSVEKQRESQN